MQLAYHFYVNYGLKINRVLTLDTGVYWNLDCYSLTQVQCNAVAEAGTEFYLFEEPAFIYDLQKAPIRYILQSGIPTTALICKHDNHDTISRNAYAYGLFDFCAGEEIDLPSWEYFPVTLYDGISQLGDIFWEDEP